MSKIFQFGENVEGYTIPVLNEREIRAGAGILFLFLFMAIMQAILIQNFVLLKHMIVFFLTDLVIRVLINPAYAPSLIVGRLIVRNQVPEYVGAPQKRFAWVIGIIFASVMLIHIVVLNGYGPVAGLTCMICLAFLFFEAAFGICLGCKIYPPFFKGRVQHCPGEVCEVHARQPIQKTSPVQIMIVSSFLVYIFLISFLFHDLLHKQPYDIMGIEAKVE